MNYSEDFDYNEEEEEEKKQLIQADYIPVSLFDLPVNIELFQEEEDKICNHSSDDNVREFTDDIQIGIFTSKFENGEIHSGHLYNTAATVDKFYKICKQIKETIPLPPNGQRTFSLYRHVSANPFSGYNPEDFDEGEIIKQIIPMSTSIEPEFPVYIWGAGKSCCLLKINVRLDDENLNMICIQPIDRLNCLKKMFENKGPPGYQSEITLGPGQMTVANLYRLLVPSKEEYRQNVKGRLNLDVKSKNYLKNLAPLGVDFKNYEKIMIEVDYTPYSHREWERIFFKEDEQEEEADQYNDDTFLN
jgi:hypothetical protein